MMFIGCILVVLSVHILFNECTGCTSDVLSVYSLISGCTAYTDGVQCVPWAYSVCHRRTIVYRTGHGFPQISDQMSIRGTQCTRKKFGSNEYVDQMNVDQIN